MPNNPSNTKNAPTPSPATVAGAKARSAQMQAQTQANEKSRTGETYRREQLKRKILQKMYLQGNEDVAYQAVPRPELDRQYDTRDVAYYGGGGYYQDQSGNEVNPQDEGYRFSGPFVEDGVPTRPAMKGKYAGKKGYTPKQ